MKKIKAIIIALVMLVSLSACGGKSESKSDPNVGMWHAVTASMLDITQNIEEVFEQGVSVDLKANGKFDMMLDGDKIKGKWAYKDDKIILSHKDVDFTGSIDNGILTLVNMMDIGLDLSFEKEGGYSGATLPKKTGDAGYYVIERASEGGVEISKEEIEEMGMDASVLLSEDGTFVSKFGEDDIDTGTWEKGVLNFTNEQGEIEGSIDYKLAGDELTIDWGDDFIAIYMRSNDPPPAETAGAKTSNAKNLSELQQLWDGEWYGYWEAHSVTDKYLYHDDAIWDCYAKIEMNPDDTGTIYLWEVSEDLATVDISISQDGGSGKMGAAISESGHYWNGDPVGRADWIIDPSIYEYEDYMVIDGRYEDENGEGFNYVAYLRPWGRLWDDIPEDARPPWYGWYTENYKNESMVEVVGAYNGGRVHTEIAYTPAKQAEPSGGDSQGKDGIGGITGERISTGIISALCPDGWKSYDVADYFSDDPDAIDLTRLEFHKGAKSPDDKYLTHGVDIAYFDKNAYFITPTPTEYMVDNFKEWGPKDFSGRSWKGFIDLDRGDTYISTKEGDYNLLVIIYMESDDAKISVEDADVQAIISSIGIE